jgi:hypothetical protein
MKSALALALLAVVNA